MTQGHDIGRRSGTFSSARIFGHGFPALGFWSRLGGLYIDHGPNEGHHVKMSVDISE